MEAQELLTGLEQSLAENYLLDGYEDIIPEQWKDYPLCWLAYGERDGCIREGSPWWNDDVMVGVKNLFYDYYHFLADEIERWISLERKDHLTVYIDPSYEDITSTLVIQHSRSLVVYSSDRKAWNFEVATPEDLAEELDGDFHAMAEAIERNNEKNRVVVFVEGGLLQEVLTSKDIDVLLIDQDVNGDDREQTFTDMKGEEFEGAPCYFDSTTAPELVGHYFSQVKE